MPNVTWSKRVPFCFALPLAKLSVLLYHASKNDYKRNWLINSKNHLVRKKYRKIVTELIHSKSIRSVKKYNGYRFSLLMGNDTCRIMVGCQ